jgi:hypothetical protein
MFEADQVMKIQELGDSIYIAESEKTPFARLLKRGDTPNQMLSSWPCQKYPDRKFGGTMDGTDISTFNKTEREEVEGYAMWLMTEGWLASRLANVTKTAGVKKESIKQAADDSLVLAYMHEKQMLSNVDTQVETAPVTPFRSRAAFQWLNPSAQSVKPVPANFRPSSDSEYTGAIGSFLPANMETMLEAAATAKKGPVDLTGYVGLKLKAQMSKWAQLNEAASATKAALTSYNINASEKKLINSVDVFEFDAGRVSVMPSFYLYTTEATGEISDYTSRSGLFLEMSMWEVAFLDNPKGYVLPPESGGPRGYHDTIFILKCFNPLGQCRVVSNT